MPQFRQPAVQLNDLDGNPLQNGKLYFGLPNLNPETNPVTVYWDSLSTQPAAQPIATLNGYPVRNGNIADLYVPNYFSLTVKNNQNSIVFYKANLNTGGVNTNVKDFGATGDGVTNDTLAIQAAINSGAGRIYFPSGIYKISAALLITSPTLLCGDGPKASVICQTSAASNGLNFDFPLLVQGGGVVDLSVEAGAGWVTSGFQGSGSTGIGIRVKNSNGKFVAKNYGVHNFDTSVSVNGCYYTWWSNGEHFYATTAAVVVDTLDGTSAGSIGAGNSFMDSKYSNFGFSGTNTGSAGIKLLASGGDMFGRVDATTFNNAVLVQPTTGKQVLYSFFDSVLADTSVADSWVFDGTNAKVWSIQCVGCWAAYSTNGAGLVTKGANLDSVRWTGGRLRENGLQGWSHQSGLNVELVGVEIASNSKLSSNTYDGVLIAASVSSWGIESCRIGNYASSLTGQANNIAITAGASQNFRIIGNDLSNSGAGKVPILNGSSLLNYVILNNLPIQNSGVNLSSRIGLNGGSASTPAAGGTFYLGAAGSYGSVNSNPFVIVKPGIISGFYVAVTTAPGAGQSFTYTVYKNGSPTTMSGAISGAASFSVAVSGAAISVLPTDLITMQLVTSAGAAVSIHNFALYLEQ
jgi:hypothetical protein